MSSTHASAAGGGSSRPTLAGSRPRPIRRTGKADCKSEAFHFEGSWECGCEARPDSVAGYGHRLDIGRVLRGDVVTQFVEQSKWSPTDRRDTEKPHAERGLLAAGSVAALLADVCCLGPLFLVSIGISVPGSPTSGCSSRIDRCFSVPRSLLSGLRGGASTDRPPSASPAGSARCRTRGTATRSPFGALRRCSD